MAAFSSFASRSTVAGKTVLVTGASFGIGEATARLVASAGAKVVLVARPGAAVTEDELRAYLKDRLARFKVPRDFVFLARLPRNAPGKVVKRELIPS